jgi:hydroxymethylbilane synthase
VTRAPAGRLLRIGSRGSDLALWQARHVASRLNAPSELVVIRTAGDQIQHLSLDKVEGKGFFTKEIETALMSGQIDLAVHSYKDLPIEEPAGLEIVAVPARGPVRDVVVTQDLAQRSVRLWSLMEGCRVGTSSLRRKAQILSLRPDLAVVDLRGNVPTRIAKVTSGALDAVILAEAGLLRLNINPQAHGIVMTPIDVSDVCPAPAQGALAIQTRSDDYWARSQVQPLDDPPTVRAVEVERKLLARFGGGCHLPLGAFCRVDGATIDLTALVAAPDGRERVKAHATGASAARVVDEAYAELVKGGAERYL